MSTTLTPLTIQNQPFFEKRVNALSADSQRRFGTMTPTQALAHLTRSLELSLGEIKVPNWSVPGIRSLVFWFVVYRMKWPQGKIKAPKVFFPKTLEAFDVEKTRFLAKMKAFTETRDREPGRRVLSSFFGPLTLAQWADLNGKHLNHHLGQFGV